MALIQCSECGQQISDKAEFCPHCGLPMKPKTTRQFRILTGSISENNFAIWLKVIAAITLVGGVIAAAFGANQQVTYGYSTRNVFNTTYFLSTLATSIETAFILWSLGKIVQMIHETHEMVGGINLREDVQQDSTQHPRPGEQKSVTQAYPSRSTDGDKLDLRSAPIAAKELLSITSMSGQSAPSADVSFPLTGSLPTVRPDLPRPQRPLSGRRFCCLFGVFVRGQAKLMQIRAFLLGVGML